VTCLDVFLGTHKGEPLLAPETAAGLEELFRHLAAAVESFAILVTSQMSSSAEQAEADLATQLEAASAARDTVAQQLLSQVQEHPYAWQPHGALLAEGDRILDELNLEHRTRRLMEELDRETARRRARYDRFSPISQVVRPTKHDRP
jgi:hypothetical protein